MDDHGIPDFTTTLLAGWVFIILASVVLCVLFFGPWNTWLWE